MTFISHNRAFGFAQEGHKICIVEDAPVASIQKTRGKDVPSEEEIFNSAIGISCKGLRFHSITRAIVGGQ